MVYDRELAMQICKEMGLEWDPNGEGTMLSDERIDESIDLSSILQSAYCGSDEGQLGIDDSLLPVEMSVEIWIKDTVLFDTECMTKLADNGFSFDYGDNLTTAA